MCNEVQLFRFADDAVIICRSLSDARAIMDGLPKRLARFGLELNRDKTRLVDFRRPWKISSGETVDFLGFTLYWGKSLKGNTVLKYRTARKRLEKSKAKVRELCRKMRHKPIAEQCRKLNEVLNGQLPTLGYRTTCPPCSGLKVSCETHGIAGCDDAAGNT